MSELRRSSETAARRVLEALGSEGATAWDLKMGLKLSHTRLHLALGMLLERGAIHLEEDRLTFRVRPAAPRPTAKSSPAPDSTPEPSSAAN